MGTRADFYMGRGPEAQWLGSVAYDGYPDGFQDTGIFEAKTEKEYLSAVAAMLADRDDATLTEHGWPWPWENSLLTDYAYAFDGGKVYGSGFGRAWFEVAQGEPEDGRGAKMTDKDFPDMTKVRNVTLGKRSGLIVLGG